MFPPTFVGCGVGGGDGGRGKGGDGGVGGVGKGPPLQSQVTSEV